jgi:hypothetical protein
MICSTMYLSQCDVENVRNEQNQTSTNESQTMRCITRFAVVDDAVNRERETFSIAFDQQ